MCAHIKKLVRALRNLPGMDIFVGVRAAMRERILFFGSEASIPEPISAQRT